eukprot:TRINITY_DN7026_c0_g1_i1.p1 TRINITY_DN7026_c0_g1~~TRINITY_DN7026_c0_g1_i1.p1  ORF type:complete len:1050 (-),score=275.98 TRINITY_DN7026_c0_g1_i1:749-3898(-)
MEALMERIRSKSDSLKSLTDSSKTVRMGMADRRHSLDTNDKAVLRACLDTLQTSISVRSVNGMSERLETTARQMGLKFMVHSTNPNTHNFYISTETFYVEICIDQNGTVLETRIHHQNPQGSMSSTPNTVSAPEISDCLSKGDFTMFVEHIKGLMAVYDLPDCGNVDKSRAWQALYNLEHDLTLLASGQSWVTDINQLIHKTGLGMVHNRAGGIPMKLRFFLPPYELLDMEAQTILPMNQSTITDKNLGFCATITLRPSRDPFLLPLSSLISSTGQDLPITQTNAIPLPAHFTLALDKPLPLSSALIRHLVSVTSIDWLDSKNDSPLLTLITKQASDGSLDPSNNRGLFVTLPDQQHCYFMTETPDLVGQTVEYIPFRHPNQVPAIVDILRRQALFNTLISSCVRTNGLEDVDTSIMFEVTCLDPMCQTLSITFEHPTEETMATAELTLSDLTAPRCRVYTGSLSVCPEETANKVLQRCLSIPVTMRAVINRGKGDTKHAVDDDTEIPIGGHSNGVGHNNSETDHKGMNNGVSNGRFKMESGRNNVVGSIGTPAVCDPGGGPGGGRLKQEPMDTDNPNDPDSLNRCGPQDADSLPGARSTLPKSPRRAAVTQPTDSSPEPLFRHPCPPSQVADRLPRSENRRKSDSAKSEYEVNQLSVSVSRGPLSDNQNRPKKDLGLKSPKDGRPIQPNVSITPIGDSNLGDDASKHAVPTTGIEIIPLGGKPITTGMLTVSSVKLKAKARDLKRSLSEDDKRRLQKKEKKRRDEKQRQSLSSHRTENCGRPQSESPSHKADYLKLKEKDGTSITKITLTDPKAKLAGVIERLAYQTGDSVAIEIKPSSSLREKSGAEPNVEITLDRLKTKPDEKDEDYALKPKLKLTIKTPNKHSEPGNREKKGESGGKLFDDMVSPKLDKTFQIPKLSKLEAPTFKKEKSNFSTKSPSTSPKHSSSKSSHSKSSHSKINERFITDPSSLHSKRSEERKRSSDRDRDSPHFKPRADSDVYKSGGPQASVSMHIVKSPAPTIHVGRCDLVLSVPLVHHLGRQQISLPV